MRIMTAVITALILAGTLWFPNTLHYATATSPPSECDPLLGVCFSHQIITDHFAVMYETSGPFAVSDGWANNVSVMAENSFRKLVIEDGFPVPARIPIPIYLDLNRESKQGGHKMK